ncbi:CBS domain-containing protein CBSX3, mitochondrial [Abrus precatorius]|uniref:CBS domain-containing protein CBSX3, mitochondrial n=1 Tax=Abrus precatorius TaxID=3816 RepID=A0A8B8LHV0_ABRPR|nr:CBS domain-containing protein CBSX3, mitochondrial [Abrus precatorius]XP_027355947.1 CBS domain-containing protein CBSX3, mitochondrial [Abrus precatorius]
MLGVYRILRRGQNPSRAAIFQQFHGNGIFNQNKISSGFGCATSSPHMQQKGLENVTVSEVLMTKGEEKIGSWLCCQVDDAVINAMKNMAENNIGSLVVLKPENQHIAGIVTERDCLRKIVAQGRSPSHTQVGQIMTDEKNLITVTSDTNILQAMRLMTENHIRHVPVIDGKIVGMISIVDVVRAIMEQQSGELKRLNDYIKGEYY